MPTRPPTHKPPRARLSDGRPSASARGYDARWRKIRLQVLERDPVCQQPGCTEPATEVDHRLALNAGGTHDETNLMSLCKSCHSRKTVARDQGFGRQRKGG